MTRAAYTERGLAFITEGAIPFAAADPIRVIPSMVAGSAVAHALPGFEVIVVDRCGHNALLYDPRAIEAVAARIRSVVDAP